VRRQPNAEGEQRIDVCSCRFRALNPHGAVDFYFESNGLNEYIGASHRPYLMCHTNTLPCRHALGTHQVRARPGLPVAIAAAADADCPARSYWTSESFSRFVLCQVFLSISPSEDTPPSLVPELEIPPPSAEEEQRRADESENSDDEQDSESRGRQADSHTKAADRQTGQWEGIM
jgi:hypothetical protein